MAAKLALRGGFISPSEYHLPARSYCTAPVLIGRRAGPKHGLKRSLEVSMYVPCRKCPKCLKFRRLRWRERMESETLATKFRTWFVTFTFDPLALAGILAMAHSADPSKLFEQRVDEAAYKHLQRAIKRLRKSGAAFRYVFVFERGEETGRPHYHGLIHESGPAPVTYRQIAGCWRFISHAKLMPDGDLITFRYISKYLGKSLSIRPRASLKYGSKVK